MEGIKRYIILIFIFFLLLAVTSCNDRSKNETIQIWYDFSDLHPNSQNELYDNIIRKAELYCNRNNIPLEIVKYDKEMLNHEDYIFKRNLAAANGNMIIIDNVSNLFDLTNTHTDYTKLDFYDSILEPYKNRFCIPIGRFLKTSYFENTILEYYNIDAPKIPMITYVDYLDIKQELKKRGAKFENKNDNLYETLKYYLNKNGLLYVNRQTEILKDNNKLKEALKKTIFNMFEDIILYENDISSDSFLEIKEFMHSALMEIYDSNSGLYFREVYNCDYHNACIYNPLWFSDTFTENAINKTFIIDYYRDYEGKFFFMHKKVTNNKIYDLADHILKISTYIYNPYSDVISYIPISYTESVFEELKLNENFEYIGIANEDELKVINGTYEVLVKDNVKSREIADAYYSEESIVKSIERLIYNAIYEILEEQFEGNNLSIDRFNSKREEVNEIIDRKIDEFIKHLVLNLIE